MSVLVVGLSHRSAPVELLEKASVSSEDVPKLLDELARTGRVGEAVVLSTISLIVGSFFAVQFPLLNVFDLPTGTYLIALGLAVAFIYLLVVICAFYPGRQAAAIYPAVALHED